MKRAGERWLVPWWQRRFWFRRNFWRDAGPSAKSGRVNDSKRCRAEERAELWLEFEELVGQGQIHATFGVATVAEVEPFNILGATKLAMRRALEGIYPASAFEKKTEPDLFSSENEKSAFQPTVSCQILIDGLALRSFPYPHQGIVSGDARSLCVAMASIVAKVTRDRLDGRTRQGHPGYGFAQHKGYGTEEHREAILKLGRCIVHRDSFLRKLFAQQRDLEGQMILFD